MVLPFVKLISSALHLHPNFRLSATVTVPVSRGKTVKDAFHFEVWATCLQLLGKEPANFCLMTDMFLHLNYHKIFTRTKTCLHTWTPPNKISILRVDSIILIKSTSIPVIIIFTSIYQACYQIGNYLSNIICEIGNCTQTASGYILRPLWNAIVSQNHAVVSQKKYWIYANENQVH